LVTPAVSKAEAQRMREAMTPGRPSNVRIRTERLSMDFFRDAWNELKKVHWPTLEQARNLTALVIAVSVSTGVILGGMDFVLSKFFEFILQTQ
jgi:preprotein translocase SecE subunit